MNANNFVDVVGYKVFRGNLSNVIDIVKKHLQYKEGLSVLTLNLEMIYRSEIDKTYSSLTKNMELCIADGIPIVWISKFKKLAIDGRANGTDLVYRLIEEIDRFAIVGGTNTQNFARKGKKVHIEDGIIDIHTFDYASLASRLDEADIRLVFIALGVPKQDYFSKQLREADVSLITIGVGGAFDLLSGMKNRAPILMQKLGLEWLHRLVTEPKRLWRRYLLNYPIAIFAVAKDLIKK